MKDSPFAPVPENSEYIGIVRLDCPCDMLAHKYRHIENGIAVFYYKEVESEQ